MRRPAPSGTQARAAVVKAVGRAHHWKRILAEGRLGLITGMASAERTDLGYIGRSLQLTLLAPDVAEVVQDGRRPSDL